MFIQNQKSRGFTLVELLIVITIIGILAGLATTAAIYVRQIAVDTTTKTQLSQMEIALEAYKSEFGEYPPMLSDQPAVMRHAGSRWKRAGLNYDAILNAAGLTLASTDSQKIAASLTFWLGGIYDGDSYIGFSANLEDPLNPAGKQRTEARFEFSEKNLFPIAGTNAMCFAVYEKPVVYFRSKASGDTLAYLYHPDPQIVGLYPLYCDLGEFGVAVPYAKSTTPPTFDPTDPAFDWQQSSWDSVKVVWHGAKKYQLIHPGRNGVFGDRIPGDPKTFFARTSDTFGVTFEDEDNITNFTDTATLKGALDK